MGAGLIEILIVKRDTVIGEIPMQGAQPHKLMNFSGSGCWRTSAEPEICPPMYERTIDKVGIIL
jgi:hypothetical protein